MQAHFCALLDFEVWSIFFLFGEEHRCRAFDFANIAAIHSAVDPIKSSVAQTVGNGSLKEFKIR